MLLPVKYLIEDYVSSYQYSTDLLIVSSVLICVTTTTRFYADTFCTLFYTKGTQLYWNWILCVTKHRTGYQAKMRHPELRMHELRGPFAWRQPAVTTTRSRTLTHTLFSTKCFSSFLSSLAGAARVQPLHLDRNAEVREVEPACKRCVGWRPTPG